MNRRKGYWSASMNNPNPSPAGTPENSPAIHRWGIASKRNESRQGRKRIAASPNAFFRPSGAWASLHPQPTVETVGYYRSSLTGLGFGIAPRPSDFSSSNFGTLDYLLPACSGAT